MENNTVIEQGTGTDSANQGERTFTQEELNKIVGARVLEERSKYSDYETLAKKASKFDEMEEANKSELQKANEKAAALQAKLDSMNKANEIRVFRDNVSQKTGVPANLLTADTEEACMEQAQAIMNFKNNNSYPSVKDGGEVTGVPTPKKSNGELFGDFLSEALS